MSNYILLPKYQCALVREETARLTEIHSRQIKSPLDAGAILAPLMRDLDREHVFVLMMDTRNNVIGIQDAVVGGLNQATLRMADLFKVPILSNASSVIVAHNHPSGDPAPSPEDVKVTRTIIDAGKLLEIDVLDHLVIGDEQRKTVSMKERGLGFE